MNRRAAATAALANAALPEYRVRRSARARHVNLTINPIDGLVVVVPQGFDERMIPALIREQRDWIDERLARLAAAGKRQPWTRPAEVTLAAAGQSWRIEYVATAAHHVRIDTGAGQNLRIRGNVGDEIELRKALRRWLKRQARSILVPRLQTLASQHALRFTGVSIRHQRSRWGSCSMNGTINLNAKLAFLVPPLVDHVLLHELCHLVYRDHGPDFQHMLNRLDPQQRRHRLALHQVWANIPDWARR